MREQDARTERAEAPPPRLRMVAREGTPPTFCPTFCPTHARTGRASGKAQGPRLLVCAGGAERYAPLLQPHSRDSRTRKRSAQPPPLFARRPRLHAKGGTTVPPSPMAPTPTHTRTRRANEHAGTPPPRWCPPVSHVHRGLLPLPRVDPLHANGECEEEGGGCWC